MQVVLAFSAHRSFPHALPPDGEKPRAAAYFCSQDRPQQCDIQQWKKFRGKPA
jgi:hypothetical protein